MAGDKRYVSFGTKLPREKMFKIPEECHTTSQATIYYVSCTAQSSFARHGRDCMYCTEYIHSFISMFLLVMK